MNSATQCLTEFEDRLADGFPVGANGALVLEQLEHVDKLLKEAKTFYKLALSKDPSSIPGWRLKPGAMRRTLGDPAKVWDRVSGTLSSEQFMAAISIQVARLQEAWAQEAGVPASKARAAFDELLGELVHTWQNEPTLARTK